MLTKESLFRLFREAPARLLAFFKAQPRNFVESAKELRKIYSIAGMAMLLALSIVLNQFSIQLTPELKLGVGFVVTALLGMLYGPVAGGVAAGLGDVIKFIIKPTGPFFFGYTLNAILGGVIYGFFFYKGKPGLARSITAKAFINVFLNAMLGTLWSSMLYGKGFGALFEVRLGKNLLMLPVEIIVLFLVTTAVAKAAGQVQKRAAH